MELGDDAAAVVNTEPVTDSHEVLDREELERELIAVRSPITLFSPD